MAYLLDSNVFIQAKNLHYGFDFCPAFWDWVVRENASGNVFSIDKVQVELQTGNDDLTRWATAQGHGLFLPIAPEALPALTQVSVWAASNGYTPAAINTFLQSADYWLVGAALASGYTVVTHEVMSPSTNKIKIPNACVALSVPCLTPFQMLRAERARFFL